jgi:uncharacterized protein
VPGRAQRCRRGRGAGRDRGRRFGYYALPILYGDKLVGKLDATADRSAGVLRMHAIHQDVAFTKAMTTAVNQEIRDLAAWLKLDLTFE